MNKKKWLLLGSALSVVWALSAGVRQHNEDVESATRLGDLSYTACIGGAEHAGFSGTQACEQERQHSVAIQMENSGKNVAFIALAPIPLSWLAGYLLLMLWRIQVAGFRAVFPWGALTRTRKLALYGCGAAIAAGCLMLALAILNLYAEARAPVALATPVTVFEYGDETVSAEGTWTRHGTLPGSEMGYPLQVSRIICTRSERRCSEARATVAEAGQSGGASVLLTPDLTEYEVSSWANGVITYKSDDLCSSESYAIDLNTKSVSGLGRATNDDNTWCKNHPATEREWNYRMEDGFKVYWPLRQKNRPAALKIIQSFFGN